MSEDEYATAEEAIVGAMLEVGYPADTACSTLDQVKAAAWAEGYTWGVDDERIAAGWGYPAQPNRVNPYRKDARR